MQVISNPKSHFGTKKSTYNQILDEICQEEQIQIDWLSDNWLGVLERAGQRRYILGHKFDLNPAVSELVADDKYATFEILYKDNIPVIEHQMVYEASNKQPYVHGRNSVEYVTRFFQENGKHIVIKPNNGQCGNNVYQITAPEQIAPALKKVLHQAMSGSLCPFYHIQHEYRLILLDGEERLSYQKNLGEDWRFNLDKGATATPIENRELHQRLLTLAKRAANSLHLRFCSVDIIDTFDQELLVMEVNSGVMTEHYLQQYPEQYETIKNIYRDAVKKMFGA